MDIQKEKRKQLLLNQYQEIYVCPHCNDFMIPTKRTYTEFYRGKTIKIRNFPFKKCTNRHCEVEYFDSQSTKIALRKARRKNFLNEKDTNFEYREIKEWKE